MIGVIHSGIIEVCSRHVTELYVRPTGEVTIANQQQQQNGVKFRVSSAQSSKTWNDGLVKFAEQLQGHVLSCQRCKSVLLGTHVLTCFSKEENLYSQLTVIESSYSCD